MPRPTTKKSANHLRAWREFRGMSQNELATKVETAGNVIGLLESGERQLSPKWLRKLAPALGTTPGYLLDHDPNDLPTNLLDIWVRVEDADKPRVLEIIKTFTRTGTEG